MIIVGICDKDTAVGLRLAGIKDIYIPTDNIDKIWNEILERDDIGVIFITERISKIFKNKLDEYRLKNILPIIVEIPDKKGRIVDHEDYVSHLIKRAVGVEINK